MAEKDINEKSHSTILWRIENLGHWKRHFHNWEIESPEFRLINLSENGWTLSIFPEGEDDPNWPPSLILRPSDFKVRVSFNCEWSLLNSDGLPILTSIKQYETEEGSNHEMPEFPTYQDIFETRKFSFLPNDTLTVRLRIWNLKKDFTEAEHISAVTRLELIEESFVWRIERFSIIQLDEEIVNTVKAGDIFKFIFSLTGASLSEADVNFSIVTEKVRRQSLKLRLTISDKYEKLIKHLDCEHVFDSSIPEQTWVLPKFTSRREILETLPDGLCNDDLNISCELTLLPYYLEEYIERSFCGPPNCKQHNLANNCNSSKNDKILGKQSSKIIVSKGSVQTAQTRNRIEISTDRYLSLTSIGEDFLSFYSEQTLSDFELRSRDTSFSVHKMVLSARSPVFRAMLCGDMKEANSSSMDIPDLDVHTLGRMLTFLYSGTVEELEWENAAKLYYAADKYQISSLKQECSTVLRSSIVVSNVSDILELADRHQDQGLTSHVHDFIQDHFDDVILSDEWDKFLERSVLAGKTMKEIYKKRSNRKT